VQSFPGEIGPEEGETKPPYYLRGKRKGPHPEINTSTAKKERLRTFKKEEKKTKDFC